jgi:hypothetical protein
VQSGHFVPGAKMDPSGDIPSPEEVDDADELGLSTPFESRLWHPSF